MRKVLSLALIIVFMCSIALCATGCNATLTDIEDVKGEILECFPEAEIVKVEETEESRSIVYTVKNKGIEFICENYLDKDSVFGLDVSRYSSDYFDKLMWLDEISNFLNKNGIELKWNYDSVGQIRITSRVELQSVYQKLAALEDLLYDYLPEKKFYGEDIRIYVYDKDENMVVCEKISHKEDVDWEYRYKCTLVDVKDSEKSKNDVKFLNWSEYDAIPQKYITSLYVNGELFTSDRYETKFVYSVKDDMYYTTVGFGVELDYNGGVEDYLQREIIQKYYPDSKYRISNDITTYKIDTDSYKVVRNDDDSLTFYKNRKQINVENYEEIEGSSSGATYFRLISVYDFAELMGMSVESVTDDGIYLSTK